MCIFLRPIGGKCDDRVKKGDEQGAEERRKMKKRRTMKIKEMLGKKDKVRNSEENEE